MAVFITGDTHGDFGGVWNGSPEENYWLDWLEDKPFTTLFISGNHENYDFPHSLCGSGSEVWRSSSGPLSST